MMKMKKNNWTGLRTVVTVAVVAAVCVGTVGCNKRCRCTKNNMKVDYYTPDELDERGKTCAEMEYLEGLATKYYSLCEWEY